MQTKALRLPCWNAYGFHSRKQGMYHFLGQLGIDICPLTENRLSSGEVFGLQTMFFTAPTG
jgi:hypothetical protein